MDRIIVRGGQRLAGSVPASGSKNSTLALMAGALLADGVTELSNVPRLRDVDAMLDLLGALGAEAAWVDDDAASDVLVAYELDQQLVRTGHDDEPALTADILDVADVLAVEPDAGILVELARGVELDFAEYRVGRKRTGRAQQSHRQKNLTHRRSP